MCVQVDDKCKYIYSIHFSASLVTLKGLLVIQAVVEAYNPTS